jgi:hypothetical protein
MRCRRGRSGRGHVANKNRTLHKTLAQERGARACVSVVGAAVARARPVQARAQALQEGAAAPAGLRAWRQVWRGWWQVWPWSRRPVSSWEEPSYGRPAAELWVATRRKPDWVPSGPQSVPPLSSVRGCPRKRLSSAPARSVAGNPGARN